MVDDMADPTALHLLWSTQADGIVTAQPLVVRDIPNPGASLEVVRLSDGNWIMVGNDIEQGRYSLAASLSDDEGATWTASHIIDLGGCGHHGGVTEATIEELVRAAGDASPEVAGAALVPLAASASPAPRRRTFTAPRLRRRGSRANRTPPAGATTRRRRRRACAYLKNTPCAPAAVITTGSRCRKEF